MQALLVLSDEHPQGVSNMGSHDILNLSATILLQA